MQSLLYLDENFQQKIIDLKVFLRFKHTDKDCKMRKSLLTNLIPFYNSMTHLVDKGKTLDVVYPDISKAHIILPEKLSAHGLDGCICWVKKLGPKSGGE